MKTMMLVDYVQRPLFLAIRAYQNGDFNLTAHRPRTSIHFLQYSPKRTHLGKDGKKTTIIANE